MDCSCCRTPLWLPPIKLCGANCPIPQKVQGNLNTAMQKSKFPAFVSQRLLSLHFVHESLGATQKTRCKATQNSVAQGARSKQKEPRYAKDTFGTFFGLPQICPKHGLSWHRTMCPNVLTSLHFSTANQQITNCACSKLSVSVQVFSFPRSSSKFRSAMTLKKESKRQNATRRSINFVVQLGYFQST